jgi:hypothetical protein
MAVPGAGERVKVGISACFFHADPKRPIFTARRCSTSSSRSPTG